MAADIPQLLPPVWTSPTSRFREPTRSAGASTSAVRTGGSSARSIPALDAAIGEPHGPRQWIHDPEDYLDPGQHNPNEHRIVAVEKVPGPYRDQFIPDLMRRLFVLAANWNITARLDPVHSHGVYIMAQHALADPGNDAPAVVDILVELEPDWWSVDPSTRRYLGNGRRIRSAKRSSETK